MGQHGGRAGNRLAPVFNGATRNSSGHVFRCPWKARAQVRAYPYVIQPVRVLTDVSMTILRIAPSNTTACLEAVVVYDCDYCLLISLGASEV